MSNFKSEISSKICYTDLVYRRIKNKLSLEISNDEIETMILKIILKTDEINFQKIGKNIYISNTERNVRLTINSFTNRIITVDKLNKKDAFVLDCED